MQGQRDERTVEGVESVDGEGAPWLAAHTFRSACVVTRAVCRPWAIDQERRLVGAPRNRDGASVMGEDVDVSGLHRE